MATVITDVKVVGFCSKHGMEPMKDRNGNLIPDKDIWCINCNF